jgi:general secretion pathway protein K
MIRDDYRRGMVLVTVLWTIALCSALAMAAAVSFRSFAGVAAVDRDRVQGDALLTAGLEAAAGVAMGWSEKPLLERTASFVLSTGTVRVNINDEGGRIDIGKAPAELLGSLLLSIGAPPSQASNLARAIVTWRSRDDQLPDTTRPNVTVASTSGSSQKAGTPIFTDVGQIIGVPGMRPEWVAKMRSLTTVFGAETINPLTAPAGVIGSLPGVDRGQLQGFLAARRGTPNDANRLGAMLGQAQSFLAALPQQVASVQLAATLADGYTTAARAIIVVLPQDQQPYRLLVWTPLAASAVP